MKKLTNEHKELIDAVVQRHAPWIQKTIKYLKGSQKIGPQFEDDELYHAGYNAIVEALATFDPEKGSFKTHANNLIKHRVMGHVEKEMSRSGGGGVDRYFLNQAREQKKQSNLENKNQPPVLETKPAVEQEPIAPVQDTTETPKQIVPPNQPKKI